jgi:hypothetical protein
MRPVALLQLLPDVARSIQLQRKRDGSLLTSKRDASNIFRNLAITREMLPPQRQTQPACDTLNRSTGEWLEAIVVSAAVRQLQRVLKDSLH